MLNLKQEKLFDEQGFLVIDNFITEQACFALKERASALAASDTRTQDHTIFETDEKNHTSNQYFIDSSEKCAFFYEQEEGENGALCVNKIGHALHDRDPLFSEFSRQAVVKELVKDLGMKDPLLLQSMYIFKHAKIGGEVSLHQDATFLITEPNTLLGLWFALDDATINNGCLWAIPGAHRDPVHQLFVRENDGLVFEQQYEANWDREKLVPLEVKRGSVIILHSRLPHCSEKNQSDQTRQAYTLHLISQNSQYSPRNWLQRKTPLRGF